jgi:hypothetical protein
MSDVSPFFRYSQNNVCYCPPSCDPVRPRYGREDAAAGCGRPGSPDLGRQQRHRLRRQVHRSRSRHCGSRRLWSWYWLCLRVSHHRLCQAGLATVPIIFCGSDARGLLLVNLVFRSRIHMFVGLLYPDPYFYWCGSGSFHQQVKKMKKTLDFYCFLTSF